MISHNHKVLFVHIPKCGGQSIEQAFLSDLGLDWATRAPLVMYYNPEPRIGPPRLAHMTAQEYLDCKYLSREQFDSYFRFTLVRCPIRRAVSLYNYLGASKLGRLGKLGVRIRNAGGLGKGYGFDDFLEDMLEENFKFAPRYAEPGHGYPGLYWFVRPQSDFVFGPDSTPLVEKIYRLETLAEHTDELRARAGLVSEIPHANKSVARIGAGDLTEGQVARLRRLYAADCDNFGY